ncbi:PDZ domain-containing protein [Paenibacillus eucommiae]|uniref:PDZ domain-containing protein n=1 Tax=Paenibacillus eucommiae TaxID=1355755 RepID=A0ABS4IYL1_9BACL|nr:PDZ domain-containing protein [Paenibacillus eucommiae]MBP1992674.1 hypothetical protein [Paenibacillus eucommiae]
MDLFAHLLHRFWLAGLQLLINPFYYIGIIFIILQYRKQIQLERKLFHTRLHSLLDESWRTLLWGLIGGFSVSVVMMFVGVSLQQEAIILLWVISLLLILARVRFFCLAYSVGILGIAHAILYVIPKAGDLPTVGPVIQLIVDMDIPSLLVLVAVLHILEGLLIAWQGARMASPLFLEARRGRIIGGYQLQNFWPVPLFMLVPLQGGSTDSLPWNTLLGVDFASGWSFMAFPVMIGFTALTTSRLPVDKARSTASLLVLYGLILFGFAVAAHYWSPMVAVAAILSIALHEAIIWFSEWQESKKTPMYVHSPRGLTVLAVIPGSPAAEMGIQVNEIIHKINGYKLLNKSDVHTAMQIHSAFCKLEVVNRQGEIKYLQRAIFSGEHYELGIILAPDQEAMYFVGMKPAHLFTYLRNKFIDLRSNKSGKPL